MIDFENLRVKNVQILLLAIHQATIRDRTYLQRIYDQTCEHFETTLTFLIDIGILLLDGRNITFSPKSIIFLKVLSNSEHPLDILRSFLIKQLFNKQNYYSVQINDFLSRFTFHEDKMIFVPDSSENLSFAGLRNFLIDLELVEYDHKHPQYLLMSEHLPPTVTHRQLSPSFFRFYNRKCEELGLKAELSVLVLEQERLSRFPELSSMVDHVANRDVHAGYDILSFDTPALTGSPVPRYIEVKAVSQWDLEFYWTSNEIITSCEKKEQYWLYLLPVGSGCSFLIKNILMICNPYVTVFEAKDIWDRECKTYKLWPISDTHSML